MNNFTHLSNDTMEAAEFSKVEPKEERPDQESQKAGPSGLECAQGTKDGLDLEDDVFTGLSEAESDAEDEGSDFNVKEEFSKEESDSEQSSCENDSSDSVKYVSVFTKNYSKISIKEEPVDDFKTIFKEATLDFEKQKYHQQIFENIIKNSAQITLKDLQMQYISRLREAATIDIFTCSLCHYQTMNLTNLSCHLLTIHNGNLERETFKCRECNYKCNFRSYMARHLTAHKKSSKEKTSRKTASFKSQFKLKKLKKKLKKEKYPCSECNYQGRSEDGLRRHMSTHKDKTKCDLCTFESPDRNVMKDHKETHKTGKYFQCYKCNYKNLNKTTLGRHLLNEHKIANEASKRSKICEICSFACSNVNALTIHYVTHKNVNELKEDEIFKCPEPGCNHQTKLKNHLKVHMQRHKAPKFVCETCGLASRRKQTYEDHITTHKKPSEIEWLKCPTCPYRARVKALLTAHIRKGIHGEPLKKHIRKRYREDQDQVPIKTVNIPSENLEDIPKKPRRKRKPKSKNVVMDENIVAVNFGELASAFFRTEMI